MHLFFRTCVRTRTDSVPEPYSTIPRSKRGQLECDMVKYGYGRVRYGYGYGSKSERFDSGSETSSEKEV